MSKKPEFLKNTPWVGPKYRREALPENDWESRVFTSVAVAPTMTVAHIGAAGREMTHRLAAAVPQGKVVAVEFDERLYADALRDPRFPDRERVAFVKSDPCALPSNLPGGPFDLLVAHAATERCPQMIRLFSRYIRLVKEGGRVYAEMAADGDMGDVRTAIEFVAQKPGWKSHFAAWRFAWILPTEAELKEQLVMAAYAQEKVSLRWQERLVPADQFADWLLVNALPAWLTALPESRHRSFAEEVVRRYPVEQGNVRVERRIATIEGVRLWGELSSDLLGMPGKITLD